MNAIWVDRFFRCCSLFPVRDEKATSPADDEKDTACSVALTSMRESLFPKKAYRSGSLDHRDREFNGIKTPEASNEVAFCRSS